MDIKELIGKEVSIVIICRRCDGSGRVKGLLEQYNSEMIGYSENRNTLSRRCPMCMGDGEIREVFNIKDINIKDKKESDDGDDG